ncbi:hypothetical protein [Mycolicibacterium palauense]|uniref:hypothetical protein n=1 Tax=Mycolicibacterium palauense TaxID=2034511 RepID=UPI000BFEE9D7|nr:hypothetical protein [Mycolicibacterium palauense]
MTYLAQSTDVPPWSTFALVCGAVVGGLALLASAFVKNDLRLERRLYWGGWLGAAAFFTAALWHLRPGGVIAVWIGCSLISVFRAYMSTPYIKIGGRIIAFTIPNTEAERAPAERRAPPPDSYMGTVTATNLWWLMAVWIATTGLAVFVAGWNLAVLGSVAVLVVILGLGGVGDATRKLPHVRGQYLPGFVILVTSVPLWLLPPAAYLLGYEIGRRKPMGRGAPTGRHAKTD